MSSSESNPNTSGRGEDEPLLGREGDASQQQGQYIGYNLVLGTAIIAQAGIWILAATIWASIFLHDLSLFSAHPLLNSFALLLTTQAILILQPTHTPKQKTTGANLHAFFNGFATLAFLAGFIVIEYNKFLGGAVHFTSVHGRLGLITYIALYLQAIVGLTQYYTPSLYGSVDNAKSIYKYHRISGYIILVLTLATICAATATGFNKSTLHIALWAMIVASVILLVGILPRVKLGKLGFK